eukprot:4282317-Lingulodinium_polyedra.AAC.2
MTATLRQTPRGLLHLRRRGQSNGDVRRAQPARAWRMPHAASDNATAGHGAATRRNAGNARND